MSSKAPSNPNIAAAGDAHGCTQETRISLLEKDVDALQTTVKEMLNTQDAQGVQLGDGRVEFMSIKKDLVVIMTTLVDLRASLAKPVSRGEQVVSAAINWAVPAAIIAILFVLAKSGQIPGVK